MSFDWQTEEEGAWEEQVWQDEPETAVPPSRPWLTIVLIAVVVFAAGAFAYRQINQRLDETTTAVESDIFAAHNLLSRAAADQDADLGKTVLSGRDMGWSRIQSDLLSGGLFYEYPGLDLRLPDGEAAYAPLFREDERFIDLVLSPDLNEAELIYARDFLALTDNGLKVVTLQQTAVYRRGETRWLLSPPLEQFWGDWQTHELENLTFIYPQRDEEIMQEIIAGLQTVWQESCDLLPELDCTANVQIRFDTDAESLLESANPANLYDGNLRLDLPTPSLVGVPINNDGYEALRIAYGANLVSALIGNHLAYDCCRQAPIYQAMLTYQLSELGLAEWPVTEATYAELARSGVHTEMLYPYWNSTDFSLVQDEDSWQLFGFVDFLLKKHAPQTTPMILLEQMLRTRGFQPWLDDLAKEAVVGFSRSVEAISRDWWFYALTQSEDLAVSGQLISFPEQNLQINCQTTLQMESEVFPQTKLYRYEIDSDNWIEEFASPGMAFFNPLPQDDGVILQLMEVSEEQYWQTLWWRDGAGVEIKNAEGAFSISLGQMDPDGRFLLTYMGVDDEILPTSELVTLADCDNELCDSTPLAGTPYWSPNGQQILLTDRHLFDNQPYLVDGRIITLNPNSSIQPATLWLWSAQAASEDKIEVGDGVSPFWLTDELFGFIRSVPQTDLPLAQELVLMSPLDLEPQPVLQTAVLQDKLPENDRRYPLLMRYAIAHPTDPNMLLLMASTQANDSYIFQVNIQTQEASLLFQLDLSRGEHSLSFSPDGRFLVATGAWWQETNRRDINLPFGVLHLYDWETAEHQTILINNDIFLPTFTFDWSLDGRWLAFTRDSNIITLLAPAYDYQQTIVHEAGNCSSLAWINP